MNKNFAVYLFLLGLIIYVHAADVMVNVGNAKGENVFEPAKILALPGDNVCITIFLFIFFFCLKIIYFYSDKFQYITRLSSLGFLVNIAL